MKSKTTFIFLITFFLFNCSSRATYDQTNLTDGVTITKTSFGYSIIPECYEMERGFIFYPGGLVEPDAYIPLMTNIAKEGEIAVFIRKMPLNLAILNAKGAETILKEYSYIDDWYIGGHSLGGVMASSFILDSEIDFKGLILLASYPIEKKPLTDFGIPTLSIVGSLDGLVTQEEFDNSKSLLPPTAEYKVIDGGNHAQFGTYGKQKGDLPATISEMDQQMITTDFIKEFILSDQD